MTGIPAQRRPIPVAVHVGPQPSRPPSPPPPSLRPSPAAQRTLAAESENPWWHRATCNAANWPATLDHPHNPEVFYPKRLEGGQCAPAKALCSQCPVRVQCLTEGLREPLGIWGGLSEKERRLAQRMVRRGSTIPQILAWFDSQRPKRRRKTVIAVRYTEASRLTGTVIEQFLAITHSLPTGADDPAAEDATWLAAAALAASLEPSHEVVRERQRRQNGL